MLISSQMNTCPQFGPLRELSFNIFLFFRRAMETSPPRATQKKDKMDGSGFSDLPKKPSETRGNVLFPNFPQNPALNLNSVSGRLSGPSTLWVRTSRGLAGLSQGSERER